MRLHVNRQVFVYCARHDGLFMLKHLHPSQKTIKQYSLPGKQQERQWGIQKELLHKWRSLFSSLRGIELGRKVLNMGNNLSRSSKT